MLKALFTIGQGEVRLSGVRPARAARLLVERAVVAHDHTYHEVCLVLSGGGVHVTENYHAVLREGSAFVVPPGQVHAIENVGGGMRVINLYYLAEWLTADLGLLWQQAGLVPLFLAGTLFRAAGVPQFVVPGEMMGAVVRELDELAAENELEKPSPVLLRATLLKALAMLTQARGANEDAFSLRAEVWHALEAIDRLIAQNGALHVEELAEEVGLSADHLGRLFKGATGRNPNQYFQQRRIHKVCHMLLDPRLSITGIAHALGYADSPHLTRMFRKYRGVTPAEWRATFAGGVGVAAGNTAS